MNYPDIRDLVPHSGRMLLIRRVLEHGATRTICEVDTSDSSLFFDHEGAVPAWLGLEYMAQCVAVHGGLHARDVGEGPREGMLLGTRRLQFEVPYFAAGEILRVTAVRVHATAQMLSFDCEIHDESGRTRLANGRLSVYVSERIGSAK